MAWRNVWRNTRRSVVTIAAMTFSLLMMILFTSFYEGFLIKMESNIVELEIGDIQIHERSYRNKPSVYNNIADYAEVAATLEAKSYQTSGRWLGSGLVASDETSTGAVIYGIDISSDQDVSAIFNHLENGAWLDEFSRNGVVIGRKLAKTLGVDVNDELVVISQAYDGSMANDLFTVRGILAPVSEATDRAGIFVLAETFAEFYSSFGGAHRLVVRRPADVDLEVALATVKSATDQTQLEVKSWRQLSPILATLVDSALQMLQLAFLVIYVAVVILLLNAMLMAVFERVREFGVLKAIGVSPLSVLMLILIEGAIQTLVAIVAAFALSVPALWFIVVVGIDLGAIGGVSVAGMSLDPVWHGVVSEKTFVMPLTTMLVVVVLGILYPAVKAARITPLEAIHHQ